MPDAAVALDAVARRHQQESARLQIAINAVIVDLFMRMGEQANVKDWTALAGLRLEAAAREVANLATSYVDTQMSILSPTPPTVPAPDLSWVQSDLDAWLPAPMVETAARIRDGEDPATVIADVAPQVERQTEAFTGHVESRAVSDAMNGLGEVVTYDGNRPPFTEQIDIAGGIAEAERFANARNAGYPVSKKQGAKLFIQIMPQIGACGFCTVRADRLYTIAVLDEGEIHSHNFCRCDWRIVTADEANAFRSVLRGSKATDLIANVRSSTDPNVPPEGVL